MSSQQKQWGQQEEEQLSRSLTGLAQAVDRLVGTKPHLPRVFALLLGVMVVFSAAWLGVGLVMLLCPKCLGLSAPGVVFVVLGVLALALTIGMAIFLRGAPREDEFKRTKDRARGLLHHIDQGIAHERQGIARREHGDVASVCALSNEQRATVRQRLPLWWFVTAPARLALFVVGAALVALPDFAMFLFDDHTALLYGVVVQPWVRGLVGSCGLRSARIAPRLDEALAALAAGTEGVEFVAAGLKRNARALVKIRDDYLTPTLMAHWGIRHLTPSRIQGGWRKVDQYSARTVGKIPRDNVLLFPVLFLAFVAEIVLRLCWGLCLGLALAFVFLVVRPLVLFWRIGDQAARVVDMARGSLVCDSAHHMLVVHKLLMDGKLSVPLPSNHNTRKDNKAVEFEVVRFKNGWADESERGYVQLLYNVRVKGKSGAVIAEVQVTHRDVFKWRKFTHKPYKVLRADNASALVRDVKGQSKRSEKGKKAEQGTARGVELHGEGEGKGDGNV